MIRRLAGRFLCTWGFHRLPDRFRLASAGEVARHDGHLWYWPCRRGGCSVTCVCLPDDDLERALARWRAARAYGPRRRP
jgi:hypothetical protein